ncbi:MAG: hypothetical protein DMG44_10585 [Acidobacteria bacterium]|nr:MAG: hypothetical protein DMG44_10585 [Acidobacteriota bacterium]
MSSSEAIRQFLVKAGEVYGRQITAPLVSIWTEELSGYPAATLAPIFRNVLRTCKFFPTPADVLEPLNKAAKRDNATTAEKAWQYTLDYCRRWISPDIPNPTGMPKLKPEIDAAARAAGGLLMLESCPASELQWRKKSFVEAFLRNRESAEHEELLTGGELGKLLRDAVSNGGLLDSGKMRQ